MGFMTGSWGTYLIVLAGCLVFSGAVSLGIRFAALGKTKLSDGDRERPSNIKRTSAAIVVSFICVVPLSELINPLTGGAKQLNVVLITTAAIFVAGLVYEYIPLPPSWCFGVDLSGGLVIWAIGNGIELQNQLPNYVAFILTILWFILIPSGFRLIDERDGMVPGVASLICLSFFVLALTNGQVLLAALAIALTGSSLGFLIIQPNPARSKLGAGSASAIGFLVAFFALMLYSTGNFMVSALVPLFVCSFVLLNAVTNFLVRLSHIGSATPLHFTSIANQLHVLGLRGPVINSVVYLGVGVTGLLTVAMYVSDLAIGIWFAGLTVSLHAIAGILIIWKTRRGELDRNSQCL
jgi:UDP-N-acetylmuramyl pentapeptide phosphotransferase/UDP-N-acetylglucosamine-1-phosphate transferase